MTKKLLSYFTTHEEVSLVRLQHPERRSYCISGPQYILFPSVSPCIDLHVSITALCGVTVYMMHRALLVCAVSYMTLGSLAFSIVPLETPSVNITARVIQNVQKSILDGLGLSSAPNINRTGIQHADAKRMLERYHRISGSEVIPETIVVGDEVDQHIFETILLLAQQGQCL